MEPITLIAAALAAGHGALEEAGKDAYRELKSLISRLFHGDRSAELALAGHADSPEDFEQPLKSALARRGVDHDAGAVRLAEAIMRAADPAGASQGKYVVNSGRDTFAGNTGPINTGSGTIIISR